MNDRACSKVISGPMTPSNDSPMTLHVSTRVQRYAGFWWGLGQMTGLGVMDVGGKGLGAVAAVFSLPVLSSLDGHCLRKRPCYGTIG